MFWSSVVASTEAPRAQAGKLTPTARDGPVATLTLTLTLT